VKDKYLGTILTNKKCINKVKLRADSSQGMLDVTQSSVFCLPICYTKNIKNKTYRTMILLPVLNGCITVSPTFREAHCLIIFETRVLRNTFGLKRDKLTGDWRKLHIVELCDLYF